MGLAPAQAGGARWIDWTPIRRGLVAGTDPDHPEYWGAAGDHDQRLVEFAAIGLALRLAPDHVWHRWRRRTKRAIALVPIRSERLHSAIADLDSSVMRRVGVHRALPNTNVVAPRSLVPQLFTELPAGTSTLACAVIASGNRATVRAALGRLPPQARHCHAG